MMSPTLVHQKRILRRGERGTRRSIRRIGVRIHALRCISRKSRSAGDLVQALADVRSQVSKNLGAPPDRGIARHARGLGDWGDPLESATEAREMFRVGMDERRKREFDPAERLLRMRMRSAEAEQDRKADAYTAQKLRELANFAQAATAAYSPVRHCPTSTLTKSPEAGSCLRKRIGLGG